MSCFRRYIQYLLLLWQHIVCIIYPDFSWINNKSSTGAAPQALPPLSAFRIQISPQLAVAAVALLLICIKRLSTFVARIMSLKLCRWNYATHAAGRSSSLLVASVHWKWMAAGHLGCSGRFWCENVKTKILHRMPQNENGNTRHHPLPLSHFFQATVWSLTRFHCQWTCVWGREGIILLPTFNSCIKGLDTFYRDFHSFNTVFGAGAILGTKVAVCALSAKAVQIHTASWRCKS